jgi:hypothetical protein
MLLSKLLIHRQVPREEAKDSKEKSMCGKYTFPGITHGVDLPPSFPTVLG